MKVTEQCSPVVLFMITLHKVVLIFESVDEILTRDPFQMKATEQYLLELFLCSTRWLSLSVKLYNV